MQSVLDSQVWVWSRQTRDEVPHLTTGASLLLRGALELADLPCPRPVEIAEQLAGGPHSPHLVPITVPIPLLGKAERRLLRRRLEEQHDILLQAWLVAFDDHDVITAGGDDLLAQCSLAVQRIPPLLPRPSAAAPPADAGAKQLSIVLIHQRADPDPPFAPAPGRPRRNTRLPAAHRVTPRHGCPAAPCRRWPARAGWVPAFAPIG